MFGLLLDGGLLVVFSVLGSMLLLLYNLYVFYVLTCIAILVYNNKLESYKGKNDI